MVDMTYSVGPKQVAIDTDCYTDSNYMQLLVSYFDVLSRSLSTTAPSCSEAAWAEANPSK